jgi:hypothetical protein
MNKDGSLRITPTGLVMMIIGALVLGGLLVWGISSIARNGFPKFGIPNLNSRNMAINTIEYQSVYQYIGKRVAIQGYVIIINDTKNICGASGWDSCKAWFSYDPFNEGLGPLTVKIPIGGGPDSITEKGDLYDHNGSHLPLVRSDAFSWYHVTVTGLVDQCRGAECLIVVDTIQGLP